MNRKPTFETRLSMGLDLRADTDEDGHFEGWLCRFDVDDSYGTQFKPGCFERGGLDEALYALLWMHDPTLPGATFTAEERTDGADSGLWIDGNYDVTQLGQDLRTRAKSGSAPGLSVGFVWRDSDPDNENWITSARLVEGSQITARMASVPGAQLTAVRHALQPIADAMVDDEDELTAIEAGNEQQRRTALAAARARLLSV